MHFFPLAMERNSFLHVDSLTLSVILPLMYVKNGAVPLCFHEIKTENTKNLSHDSSQVHQVPSMS